MDKSFCTYGCLCSWNSVHAAPPNNNTHSELAFYFWKSALPLSFKEKETTFQIHQTFLMLINFRFIMGSYFISLGEEYSAFLTATKIRLLSRAGNYGGI